LDHLYRVSRVVREFPKLSYYAAYPVEMIQQIYSQVTQEMLNP